MVVEAWRQGQVAAAAEGPSVADEQQ